ncbi:MAG: hypothetical protein NZ772_15165 [Cyanobacteria bacterium]|nr:hypothetical protein [Cyanobacteriota bacterium]
MKCHSSGVYRYFSVPATV